MGVKLFIFNKRQIINRFLKCAFIENCLGKKLKLITTRHITNGCLIDMVDISGLSVDYFKTFHFENHEIINRLLKCFTEK